MFFSIISYFLGSIPTGVILAKYFGNVDLRNVGSGNIGATNVTRAMGRKYGILTLAGDVLKGFIPTTLAFYMFESNYLVALVGFAAFLGHIYSVFLEFQGGKGVATALGVLLAVSPLAALYGLGVFILFFAVFRYVSLASLAAAVAIPIFTYQMKKPLPLILLAVLISIFVIIRHIENIKRLVNGTENKFSSRKNEG